MVCQPCVWLAILETTAGFVFSLRPRRAQLVILRSLFEGCYFLNLPLAEG
jgi:hypothetical protein